MVRMTIATPERYAQMLDAARRGGYAYPAINVTSSQTLNAALQGLADAGSDGIIQVSVGGAAYFSGQRVADRVTGSLIGPTGLLLLLLGGQDSQDQYKKH